MSQTAQASLFPAKQTSAQEPWPLPSGWEWVPLGAVCLINPRRPRLERSDDAPTSFLPMSGVDEVDGAIVSLEERPFKAVARGFTYFEEGDVLFAKITPCMQNGKCTVARGLHGCIGFGSTEFHVLRPGSGLTVDWVHGFLRRLAFRLEAKEHFRGAVGQQRVPEDFLASSLIPVPPNLDIQRHIVARIETLLAEVKEARTLAAAIRHDTDCIMEAALEQVFGQIREGFEVTGIPQGQIRPIEEVAHLERGKFTHRPRNDRRFFGGTIPWVQIQNIPRDYRKYITQYMDTLNEDGLAISKLFPKGTLIVSIAATIGAVGILGFDACFPDSLVGITPDASQIEPGFLYWQLCYVRDHLDAVAPAAAQKNVNLQILSRINLWVPPIAEQKAINTSLDTIQTEVEEMRRLQAQDAELLNQLEQSILERAFRGEL